MGENIRGNVCIRYPSQNELLLLFDIKSICDSTWNFLQLFKCVHISVLFPRKLSGKIHSGVLVPVPELHHSVQYHILTSDWGLQTKVLVDGYRINKWITWWFPEVYAIFRLAQYQDFRLVILSKQQSPWTRFER